MMYSGELNSNWGAEDDAMLIENGHLARESTCCWILPNGSRCGESVKGRDFSSHLRAGHGVAGTPTSQHRCRWEGCREQGEFTRDCLIRHLREKHLLWRWPCPTCPHDFSRKSTMFDHRDRICPYRAV